MISIHHSNFKNYVDLHAESIDNFCTERKKIFKKSLLDMYVHRYFAPVVTNLRELLAASPEKLSRIVAHFESSTAYKKGKIREHLNLTTLYRYFTSQLVFSDNTQHTDYNSTYLASKLDIVTCPYCNEQYNYSFKYKKQSDKIRRTFDWDHIYSQVNYPFLAISYFNLVPACKVCNFIKLDQDEDYFNPHSYVNVDDVYFFDLKPLGPGFISDVTKIELNVVFKKVKEKTAIKNTMEVVGQLNRMRCHRQLIRDILNKKRIYSNAYLRNLKNQVGILRTLSDFEIKQTLFGVVFDHRGYYKRSFSKLTADILKGTKF